MNRILIVSTTQQLTLSTIYLLHLWWNLNITYLSFTCFSQHHANLQFDEAHKENSCKASKSICCCQLGNKSPLLIWNKINSIKIKCKQDFLSLVACMDASWGLKLREHGWSSELCIFAGLTSNLLTCIWYSRTGISSCPGGPNCLRTAEYLEQNLLQISSLLEYFILISQIKKKVEGMRLPKAPIRSVAVQQMDKLQVYKKVAQVFLLLN